MKKIVIISYNMFAYLHRPELKVAGGAELQVSTLARLLKDRGYEITFFTGDFGQNETEKIDGITFIKVAALTSGPVKKTFEFIKYIRLIRPVAILERGSSPFTFLAAIVGKLTGTPFIFCGASDVNFAKKEIDPTFNRSRVKQRIYQWSLRFVKHFVVQKARQATLLNDNFGIKNNVSIIKNFSPSVGLPQQDQNSGEDMFDAVWVANLIPYKQPELFIELARRNPGSRFLLVGGSADKEYHDRIMNDAAGAGNVVTTGFMPPDQVMKWMQKARIIVNTTKVADGFEEGFSNVQIMGWLCGLASLTLISDPDNLIVSNGMGFRSGSLEQMDADFKLLKCDPELLKKMSQQAITYVKKNHDEEVLLNTYLEVLNKYEKNR